MSVRGASGSGRPQLVLLLVPPVKVFQVPDWIPVQYAVACVVLVSAFVIVVNAVAVVAVVKV